MTDFGDDISVDPLIDKYTEFLRPLELQLTAEQWQLAWEISERLREIRFLLRRIQTLHHKVATNPMTTSQDPHELSPMEELWLLCEVLYYVAFRAHKILEDMPFGRQFKAPGVRNVRNHLIEHPTGKSSELSTELFSLTGMGQKSRVPELQTQ